MHVHNWHFPMDFQSIRKRRKGRDPDAHDHPAGSCTACLLPAKSFNYSPVLAYRHARLALASPRVLLLSNVGLILHPVGKPKLAPFVDELTLVLCVCGWKAVCRQLARASVYLTNIILPSVQWNPTSLQVQDIWPFKVSE